MQRSFIPAYLNGGSSIIVYLKLGQVTAKTESPWRDRGQTDARVRSQDEVIATANRKLDSWRAPPRLMRVHRHTLLLYIKPNNYKYVRSVKIYVEIKIYLKIKNVSIHIEFINKLKILISVKLMV